MLLDIAKLPVRLARRIVRTVLPSKDSSSGGVSYTPASGGLKRPPEAVKAAPAPAHSHDHGHSHSHDHAAPAAAPEAPPPEAAAPEAAAPKSAAPKSAAPKSAAPKSAAKAQVDVYSERTPNPNAMKFTVGRKVVDKGSLSFNSGEEAEGSALGEAIFKVVGVKSIFAVNDFVTVTKDDSADWSYLEGAITNAIQSAF